MERRPVRVIIDPRFDLHWTDPLRLRRFLPLLNVRLPRRYGPNVNGRP